MEVERIKVEEEKFFKANKGEFDEKELLSVRKEIWDWMVLCVQGEKKDLFCAHLVRVADKWDIHQLFLQVKNFLHTENYREFGKKLEKFFTCKPDGKKIFFHSCLV